MIPYKTKYVVYCIDTGHAFYKNPSGFDQAFYETNGAALRLANRLNYLPGREHDIAAVCTVEEYTHGICPHYENGEIKMVERTNIMTGKKYMEPANTPACSSPAFELYWSM